MPISCFELNCWTKQAWILRSEFEISTEQGGKAGGRESEHTTLRHQRPWTFFCCLDFPVWGKGEGEGLSWASRKDRPHYRASLLCRPVCSLVVPVPCLMDRYFDCHLSTYCGITSNWDERKDLRNERIRNCWLYHRNAGKVVAKWPSGSGVGGGGIGKEEMGQDVVICELWVYHKNIQIIITYIYD